MSPESFGLALSLSFLVGIVVGGLASLGGVLFGALFIEFVPNLADQLSVSFGESAKALARRDLRRASHSGDGRHARRSRGRAAGGDEVRGALALTAAAGRSPPQKTSKGGQPMITRRSLLQSGAAAMAFAAGPRAAWADTPGVTDTEIKIGQTMPYSGPASAYGVIGRTEAAYFKMINEQGGVNGRKINLISLDDGYSPPKTVEQVRRLVEEEKVAFLFQTLGTPPNLGDPAISQRQQGPAAFRRDRRQRVRRPGAFSLDDRLQPELPDRGAHLRQAYPCQLSRTPRSACSIRTTASARTI